MTSKKNAGTKLSERTWDWNDSNEMRDVLKANFGNKRISGSIHEKIVKVMSEDLIKSEILTFDPDYEFNEGRTEMKAKLIRCVLMDNERLARRKRISLKNAKKRKDMEAELEPFFQNKFTDGKLLYMLLFLCDLVMKCYCTCLYLDVI